ncbi:3-phenylpropionate/cinnamic acid dioxygenase subunit beta [Phenylobacterium sp. J367]|uniref:3-phenylpropionate/cinnamic acid dioxygenase subunit beta n=1 Tax=Phenylobacterium sp. J367 TaxID=2898435 RepID=UPI002150D02B|nr:3-phenylpropionate/cinnamic acid dioxygenase subunit beta [Phenylobacterium sp. J367]MCR5879624.1 3-phenylpropionate/cinnamic acid dioxygenase subunit beta [Phenylobacterium sp. J367]
MSVDVLETPTAGARQASLQLVHDVQQLLYRDARLLDEQRYDEWFDLMTEDFRFWVPVPQSRYRRDSKGVFEPGRMAHFDDSLAELKLRASRWKEATAWSEDPPTRHVHYVTNIEVEPAELDGEWLARSVVISLRNRNEDEENWLGARREDLVRETPAGLKLAHRKVFVTQSVLLAKNFNTFL